MQEEKCFSTVVFSKPGYVRQIYKDTVTPKVIRYVLSCSWQERLRRLGDYSFFFGTANVSTRKAITPMINVYELDRSGV